MYYEERETTGGWYWRSSPDGYWIPFSTLKYIYKIKELSKQIAELQALLPKE